MDKRKKVNTEGKASLRPYNRPKVLSAEGLEAVAVTCDPPTGSGFGKTFNPGPPIVCTNLGS